MKQLSYSVIKLMYLTVKEDALNEGVTPKEYIKIILGSKKYINDYLDNVISDMNYMKTVDMSNETSDFIFGFETYKNVCFKSLKELNEYRHNLIE